MNRIPFPRNILWNTLQKSKLVWWYLILFTVLQLRNCPMSSNKLNAMFWISNVLSAIDFNFLTKSSLRPTASIMLIKSGTKSWIDFISLSSSCGFPTSSTSSGSAGLTGCLNRIWDCSKSKIIFSPLPIFFTLLHLLIGKVLTDIYGHIMGRLFLHIFWFYCSNDRLIYDVSLPHYRWIYIDNIHTWILNLKIKCMA